MEGLCLLLLISCVVALSAASNEEEWQNWKLKYGKVYSNEREEVYRRFIWEHKLNYVRNHNNRSDKQFTVHMNQFADTVRSSIAYPRSAAPWTNFNGIYSEDAPSHFDWREKGVVGPVHSEGQINDVQAIVAAESIASHHAIDLGKLYELSFTEIAQCGCGQAVRDRDIFGCIHEHMYDGICTMNTYNGKTGVCQKAGCSPVAQINGSRYIQQGNELEMMRAILLEPIMVYVDSSRPSFELYEAGVYSDPDCSQTQLDSVLQVVGYGEENGKPYWICRNSWGTNWGMQGYVLMERNKNMCGIASAAIYPY